MSDVEVLTIFHYDGEVVLIPVTNDSRVEVVAGLTMS